VRISFCLSLAHLFRLCCSRTSQTLPYDRIAKGDAEAREVAAYLARFRDCMAMNDVHIGAMSDTCDDALVKTATSSAAVGAFVNNDAREREPPHVFCESDTIGRPGPGPNPGSVDVAALDTPFVKQNTEMNDPEHLPLASDRMLQDTLSAAESLACCFDDLYALEPHALP
jgi:hypothetical protein